MQYTKRDWRNRNVIKSPGGLIWLTIPVQVKGQYFQKIKETVVAHVNWRRSHWQSILHSYAKAEYFSAHKNLFEDLYLNSTETFLSRINYRFLTAVCQILGIKTAITWSMDYRLVDGKTEKLVDICKQAGATEYLSGPSAKAYLDEELFTQAGIKLRYMNYSGYPEYRQLHGPFEPNVSIIDLIFNEGPNAKRYMKSC